VLLACSLLIGFTACSKKLDTADLITKLEQRNGLTRAEATCVSDGLRRKADSPTLKRIASARAAAKLTAADAAIVRQVVEACIPPDTGASTAIP